VCAELTIQGMKNTSLRLTKALLAVALIPGLMACANLSHRQQNAAIGAGVGAIGGSILTGGSTLGTLGGAAIGGVIGHGTDGKRR
jgi:osmotically inducible lipoprotein OsmB